MNEVVKPSESGPVVQIFNKSFFCIFSPSAHEQSASCLWLLLTNYSNCIRSCSMFRKKDVLRMWTKLRTPLSRLGQKRNDLCFAQSLPARMLLSGRPGPSQRFVYPGVGMSVRLQRNAVRSRAATPSQLSTVVRAPVLVDFGSFFTISFHFYLLDLPGFLVDPTFDEISFQLIKAKGIRRWFVLKSRIKT